MSNLNAQPKTNKLAKIAIYFVLFGGMMFAGLQLGTPFQVGAAADQECCTFSSDCSGKKGCVFPKPNVADCSAADPNYCVKSPTTVEVETLPENLPMP